MRGEKTILLSTPFLRRGVLQSVCPDFLDEHRVAFQWADLFGEVFEALLWRLLAEDVHEQLQRGGAGDFGFGHICFCALGVSASPSKACDWKVYCRVDSLKLNLLQ